MGSQPHIFTSRAKARIHANAVTSGSDTWICGSVA
jgi:hypothetical protein